MARRSLLLLCAAVITVPPASGGCPRKCECLWRSAKITVDCAGQGLAGVPRDVEAQTQVLNISGNHIQAFSARQFLKFGLTNLQKVSASGVGLTRVDDNALQGLTNLVELDLSDNLLNEIPSSTLNSHASSLMSLSLRSNVLSVVRSRAFHRLLLLQKLDLSNCQIRTVEIGAFEGLDNLQRVHLHGNWLSHIHATDIPPSLHGISLHANRWECDCNLRGFRKWLTQSNVPRPIEPICHGPRRLLEIKVSSLSLAEFACPPQLSPTSMYLTVPSGKNVSIVCRVASDPESEVSWFFNGRRIAEDFVTRSDASVAAATDRETASSINGWSLDRRVDPNTQVGTGLDQSSPIILSPYDIQRRQHQLQRQRTRQQQRVSRRDQVSNGETRSELLIQNTSLEDNGTYHCEAVNKAATAVSNFTLHVTSIVDPPEILQLRLEYFVAASILVLVFLVLVLVAVAVLLLKLCKKRVTDKQRRAVLNTSVNGIDNSTKMSPQMTSLSAAKVVPVANRMPKHIQMGTGFMTTVTPTSTSTAGSDRPDLLTDHSLNRSSDSSASSSSKQAANLNGTMSSESSRISSGSGSNVGSYQLAMENIIDEYRKSSKSTNSQLIGGATVLPRRLQQGQGRRPEDELASCVADARRKADRVLQKSTDALQCLSSSGSQTTKGPQQEFLIGGGYPNDFGLPTHQQEQQLQPGLHHHNSLQPRHSTISSNPYSTLPLHPHAYQQQHSHFPHSLDPAQLAQLQAQQQQLAAHPHYFLTLQKPPGLARNRQQVLPDEKYPSPEPSSYAGSSSASLHLYQSLQSHQAVPIMSDQSGAAVFAYASLPQHQHILPPQVPVTSSATVGILKCAKREVGVGTSSEEDKGSNHTQDREMGTLVNITKRQGEAPKGDPKTKEGKKRQNPPPPPPKKSTAIGTSGALSGSRNDNDDSTQGRVPSSLLLAPLAEMEGASSLESSSTFASSNATAGGGGERNGATNQSVARKSKSPSPSSPPNSHQSGKRLSLPHSESAAPQSIKRDAFTKEGEEGERLMGANEGKGGVNEEEEEDACSGSDLDITCTTVAEGEETEEDLEAVGERARMIYKELEDAFSSLDQKDIKKDK